MRGDAQKGQMKFDWGKKDAKVGAMQKGACEADRFWWSLERKKRKKKAEKQKIKTNNKETRV